MGASNPVTVRSTTGGVALNIARNLSLLENAVSMATIVGTDADGLAVLETMHAAKVSTDLVEQTDTQASASYTAVIDGNGELVIGLADLAIYDRIDDPWLRKRQDAFADTDALVIDANIPEMTLADMGPLLPDGVFTVAAAVSPAKAARLVPILGRLDVVFTNRSEAALLAGQAITTPDDALDAARALHDRFGGTVCITLGPNGAVAAGKSYAGHLGAITPARLRDVNGAGDGFSAGVIDVLLDGGDLAAALLRGLAVGSLTCEVEERANPDLTPKVAIARIEQGDTEQGT